MHKGVKIALWVGGGLAAVGGAYLLFFHKKKAAPPPPRAAGPAGTVGQIVGAVTAINHALPPDVQKGLGDIIGQTGSALGQVASGLFRTGNAASAPDVNIPSVPAENYADAGVNSDGIPNAIALPDTSVDVSGVDTTVDTSNPFDNVVTGDSTFASF